MAKISSGLTLSTDYFMRNFYSGNRSVITKSARNDYSKLELSFEDSRALAKAAKHFTSGDFESKAETDKEIDGTMKSSIEAFVKTYNNTIDTSTSGDDDTLREIKKMKKLCKKYEKELKDIGISMERGGKLSINDDLLKSADKSKVRKVFSPRNEFSGKALSISRKLNDSIRSHVLSEMTGSGQNINITL